MLTDRALPAVSERLKQISQLRVAVLLQETSHAVAPTADVAVLSKERAVPDPVRQRLGELRYAGAV